MKWRICHVSSFSCGGRFGQGRDRLHPVAADQEDFTRTAVLNALNGSLRLAGVAGAHDRGDLDILTRGGVAPALMILRRPGASGAKDFSMNTFTPFSTAYSHFAGAATRNSQQSIATSPGRRAVDRLAPGIEADEPPFRGHVHLVPIFLGKRLVGLAEPILEEIPPSFNLELFF